MYRCENGEKQYKMCKEANADYCSDCPHGVKENKIEKLQDRLEELHRIQEARLACGADDLDIIEEISEVEAEIKELEDDINEENNNGNDINVGSIGNSIEEDIKCVQDFLEYSQDMINDMDYERPVDVTIYQQQINSMQHILSDYKRVLKENEELKKSKITCEKVRDIQEKNRNIVDNKYIPKQKIKDIIDRIDYDIEKTKEIISKDTNVHAAYRRNDYQIVRLRAMNTKSLDIKKRLQKLLESEE